MKLPFFQFVQRYRHDQKFGTLSELIYEDDDFPRGQTKFNSLTSYMETNDRYLEVMTDFDELWEIYEERG